MSVEITMPQLSDTMSEGTLIKWHKKEGDTVKEGEEIADVETDKATMPMEAAAAGTLAYIAVPEGTKVKVGGRLGVISVAGENPAEIKKQLAGGAAAKPGAKTAPAAPTAKPVAVAVGAQVGASSHDTEIGHEPLAAGRAQSRHESVQEPPHHTSEQLSREAVEVITQARSSALAPSSAPAGNGPGRVRVSPLARRIAGDKGIDLHQVAPTGPGGRITQRDVLAFTATPPAAAAPSTRPASSAPAIAPRVASGQKDVIPLTKMRSAIAAQLLRSKQTIPHFYETIDVDVEQLTQLRIRLNELLEHEKVRLSLGDFVAKAVAIALLRHPALNATFDGTQITRYGDVNLGLAVAIPDGLIVPVLRGIDQMGLKEIRVRSVDLVEKARAQRLRQEERTGATFTVSNLGTYGVREFSAIINPPEVGILAVAAAEKRAVVRGDQIVARTMMTLTLSADHRAVDGATAAEFLRTLKGLLEEPGMMLA